MLNFKGTPSQEEHKTILHCLMIPSKTLTCQSDFNGFFLKSVFDFLTSICPVPEFIDPVFAKLGL
jgi:hypothetical protein